MTDEKIPEKSSFFSLRADLAIDTVESVVRFDGQSVRATGRVMALNSLENRVYEIEFENSKSVVAKFYRPGRWNENQLLDEHTFLQKLLQAEVPVIAPLPLSTSKLAKISTGNTLGKNSDGIYFAVFPKVRGRLRDELSDLHLRTLGRYLARLHNVGSQWTAKHRMKLDVTSYGYEALSTTLKSGFLIDNFKGLYEDICKKILKQIEPLLKTAHNITVHGDCHLGNTLWNEDAPFFLDFDDMIIAPPVQDIWMVVRGRDEDAKRQKDILIEAYETFREFDYSTLSLIEPLRALRMIHYVSWIAKRWDDPSFPQAFPNFRTAQFWREEIDALSEIFELIAQRVS